MRTSHVATALAAFTAGMTAAASLRRLADRRLSPAVPAPAAAAVDPVSDHDAVVLPFERPVVAVAAPRQSTERARCGDSGGRTKAGAPCGARAATGGRCHHHPLAA